MYINEEESYDNKKHTLTQNIQTDIHRLTLYPVLTTYLNMRKGIHVYIRNKMKAKPPCHIRNFLAGLLGCNVGSLKVTPTPPDPKNAVTVNGEKPGSPTSLNVGSTIIVVEVTSEDGSNKQVN